jgi:hypothetical protein
MQKFMLKIYINLRKYTIKYFSHKHSARVIVNTYVSQQSVNYKIFDAKSMFIWNFTFNNRNYIMLCEILEVKT